MKPNIFKFATSELSNDAIICWMLEWGNHKNSVLYGLSKDLIKLFIGDSSKDLNLSNINIRRQYKKIDILVKINDEYLIVIEDKIDTGEHSDQLERYKEVIEKDFKNFNKNNISYIYLKIGDESSYKIIENKGYRVVKRKDLLTVLEKYKDVPNDILNNYYEYLKEIDTKVHSFEMIEKIDEWSSRAWQGFYSMLQTEMDIKTPCWHYVNNRKGGFWGFWWSSYKNIYKNYIYYYTYLQIEEKRIAFKVEVENKEYQSEIRNYVWRMLKDLIDEMLDEKYKPKKTDFARGTWMTIAEINNLETKEDIRNAMKVAQNLKDILDSHTAR